MGQIEKEPSYRKICRKCLLQDMDENEYFTDLRKYIVGQGGFARVHMGGDADDHPAGLVAVCIHMQNLLCLIFLYYGRYRPGLQG